ncbi:hypothetical protein R9X47_22765 [Wukongibacter baidiensis]|uniref:hypothetical protein n=1 Tax=Wukongibacter baidiensis TaxID=1723361 RepID=UPI003D7F818A
MNENFDCTQFLSFKLNSNDLNLEELMVQFKKIGFDVIYNNQIRQVKKEYFSDYTNDEFVELECDNFIGEFEDWEDMIHPPEKIKTFANTVSDLIRNGKIKDTKIILTSFAQFGYSSNEKIEVKAKDIIEGLFSMSKHFYDVWTDNLIIELI